MIESIAFQTRARTIDHLGREQIADCPTAVSELWKNAYDAYARNVALNIYDGETPIATIADDGHGMNRDDFTTRWLVVGTESKAGPSDTPDNDRDGLAIRTKQGQKGIGRLSSANLGSLLLVVSKRRSERFVAALIDWRLFENPFLFLQDVEIPIVEFDEKHELLPLLPELFDGLMSNLWGSTNKTKLERDQRIEQSWAQFDALELAAGKTLTTYAAIEATIIATAFEERHFADWPLWQGSVDHGTALLISNIQFDLQAQFSKYDSKSDSAVEQARSQLFQTLSNFCDPFVSEKERKLGYSANDFSTRATTWEGNLRQPIIDERISLDLDALYELEHVLDGEVDEDGCFHGRIKAFGNWHDGEITIKPAINIPIRKDSMVGPFLLRIGTFELMRDSTSHSDEAFGNIKKQADKYAGLMIFRNGLRVMPYGREGNDFFRIEYRRSKHAGRGFWSLRQLFGRVALRIETNPNLRDKAGREGLIDNKATKTFRDIVEHILIVTARNYFGSESQLRQESIADRKAEYKKKKTDEARKKQRAQNRKEFRAKLTRNEPILADLIKSITALTEKISSPDMLQEEEIVTLRATALDVRQRYSELTLGEAPRELGLLEERYSTYRKSSRLIKEHLDIITLSLDTALERVKPRSIKAIASSELNANAAFLHRRLRTWVQEVKDLLTFEQERITTLHSQRNKTYHAKMMPLLDEVEHGRIPLRKATELLEEERDAQDFENEQSFEPYISALNSLKESIDIVGLAKFNQDKVDDLREELDRLHGLAQLGITVEIISHEVEGLEQTISSNLKAFPDEVKRTDAYSAVRNGYEELVERLRFLSPLKLSGPKTRIHITGKIIFSYVNGFFRNEFIDNGTQFDATPAFEQFSIFEQPARIFPVFINLVNNAIYWANHSERQDKKILLDVIDGKVVIADTGPGVDEDDLTHLFRLFFTRKVRSGRGVGLYLCKTNLAAGGHIISYANKQQKRLPGANFIIEFKGAKYE
jgi:signal transduction histidine kinase